MEGEAGSARTLFLEEFLFGSNKKSTHFQYNCNICIKIFFQNDESPMYRFSWKRDQEVEEFQATATRYRLSWKRDQEVHQATGTGYRY
jgi:hypothetical protein